MVDKDFIKNLTENLKLPGDHINLGGVMFASPSFKFGEKL